MEYCQPEQWTMLGKDYNKTFYAYQINYMYCPNITTPYKIKKTLNSENSTYVSITLGVCNKTERKGCFNISKNLNFMGYFTYSNTWLYYL